MKEKFDEIFEKVNEIPIEDVFRAMNFELTQSGCSYLLPSPFRKDSSKTSFTISPSRNIFKDWVIPGCTGNATKFVSMIENLTYFEAAMKLAFEFGIIDEKSYESIIKTKQKPNDVKLLERKYNRIERPVSIIAEDKILDKVFNIFISFCKISNIHKEHLINERGLSEEEIERYKFFTFPTRSIVRNFLKEIEKQFETQEVLKTIPGFFRRVGDNNFTFLTTKGIGIPIFNEKNLIIGIQIRKDTVKEGEQRYTWFSSSFAIDDPKNKSEFGTSSGSPIDVVYPESKTRKGIFITEGKFKALQIAKNYNCIAISVQGVSTWKPVISTIKNISNIMEENPYWEVKRIYSAFDADMACNYNVYKQLKKMTDSIVSELSIDVDYLFWDVNIGKGIDDIILSKNIQLIKNYRKKTFDESYNDLVNKVIEECMFKNEIDIVKNLSSSEFKQYFDIFFKFPEK